MKKHTTRAKTKLFVVIATLLVAFIMFDKWRDSRDSTREVSGVDMIKEMPAWTLETLDGDAFSSEYLEGDVVLLHFWGIKNALSISEISVMKSLDEEYKTEGVKVVSIVMDDIESERIKLFVEAQGIDYLVLVGDAKVINAFGGFDGIPATFIIDRDGNIKASYLGAMNETFVKKLIKSLL